LGVSISDIDRVVSFRSGWFNVGLSEKERGQTDDYNNVSIPQKQYRNKI
jgi:hypothetical protein